jgi:two-component system response regulator YesN
MKILIADDERLVRFSLKSMLEELGIPAASIQAACDGVELVERAREQQPDIAFVDIRMPRLDGLQAIQQALPLSPATRWVILTSHSSFEYARKAIGLGAVEYLLKPVSPQDLSRVVSRLREEDRDSWLHANEEFEVQVVSLFHNTSALSQPPGGFFGAATFAAQLVLLDSHLPERAMAEAQRAVCRDIRARLPSAVGKHTRLALCTLPEGPLAMIGAWQAQEDARNSSEILQAFFRKAQALLQRGAPPGVSITCLQTGPCSSFDGLLGELAELQELAPLRAVAGIGGTLALAHLREWGRRPASATLGRCLWRLARAHREDGVLEFPKALDELEKALRDSRAAPDCPELENSLRFLQASLGFRPAAREPAAWTAELAEWTRRQPMETQPPGDLISRVTEFLEANYMREVGIAQIADYLGVTPNYLSGLFHRRTGTTFVKYLTRLRLARASQLLAGGGGRVQEVARAVGYASPRHFSRLFSQQFGCHPSEYIVRARTPGPEA